MGELLLSIPDSLYYHPLLTRMMELECKIIIIDNVSFETYDHWGDDIRKAHGVSL